MNEPEQIKIYEIKHTLVSKCLLHFRLQYIYCKQLFQIILFIVKKLWFYKV